MKGKASPAAVEPHPPARVEISAGGHQVVVEATEPLNTVARKALELWRATDNPAVVRGMSTTVGFAADLPPELTMSDMSKGGC